LALQTVVRGDARVAAGRERLHVVDDIARVLAADEETAPEEVHDRHAFRADALGRSIDVEQQIDIAPLPEHDVLFDAEVAGVRRRRLRVASDGDERRCGG
jgi:hypothetical protein